MVPADIHDLFLAAASVAGALIGLLFVAISVAAERLARDKAGAPVHRIRAGAALTAFTNALTVSLFALVPGQKIGPTAVAVSAAGLLFIGAVLLSLVRLRQVRWSTARDVLFLVGLAVMLVFQLLEGIAVIAHPDNPGAVNTIAVLVVVCFLIGIARAWELIGGPSFGISRELTALFRGYRHGADDAGGEQPRPDPARD